MYATIAWIALVACDENKIKKCDPRVERANRIFIHLLYNFRHDEDEYSFLRIIFFVQKQQCSSRYYRMIDTQTTLSCLFNQLNDIFNRWNQLCTDTRAIYMYKYMLIDYPSPINCFNGNKMKVVIRIV